MPSSMTGYASAKGTARHLEVEVELKSVNGKSCEVKVQAGREHAGSLGEIEILVAKRIRAAFERGSFRVSLAARPLSGDRARFNLDLDLLKSYKTAAEFVGKELALPVSLDARDMLALPNVIEFRRGEDAPSWEDVAPVLDRAIEALARARREEGKELARDMKARLKTVETCAKTIATRDKARLREKERRLRERIDELAGSMDPARLHQEVALLLERADITEEITRLRLHLKELSAALSADGAVGKAIDFRLQETLRELNTIASKAGDMETSNATIAARGEIEKIREQAQNLE